MNDAKDQLYANPVGPTNKFVFDARVAQVFPDMLRRSIPGYATVISMSGELARRYARPGTHLYDLGCSLGATSFAMANKMAPQDCKILAIDNSTAMISGLKELLESNPTTTPIIPVQGNLEDTALENASVVAMNYTLQFVPPDQRDPLMRSVHRGLVEDGLLILSEKIRFENADVDREFIELYHDFKRGSGYSDLEISQKREALEDVLIPDTLAIHKQRLKDSGFTRVEVWFQCFNFVSLLAVA